LACEAGGTFSGVVDFIGEAAAVVGGPGGVPGAVVTPCGRCRQVLHELAALGGTDPLILACGAQETVEMRLSALLPLAFGPATLGS
jgi:cytidine deaminase